MNFNLWSIFLDILLSSFYIQPIPKQLLMFLLFQYQATTLGRKSFGWIGTENLHYFRLSIATDTESLLEGVKRIPGASKVEKGFKLFLDKREHLY